MRDADAIVDKFFYFCHLAQNKCALYRNDDSIDSIRGRYNQIMDKLREEPLIVVVEHTRVPIALTASDVKLTLFRSLYSPTILFPIFADLLDRIYREADLTSLMVVPDLSLICLPNLKLRNYPDDSAFGIGCSDRAYSVSF
jgi:hypothetical protein